ncbi:MAG TPA: UbiD family decarboxylase [Conexivisphaerales archaeon]|nr:UbiD family decarboxylase [Conexivisphaerales archaeon]
MKREAPSLPSYLSQLGAKELTRIASPVSTLFEAAALEKALDGRSAVMISRPSTGKFPIVADLLTSRRKFAEALKTDVSSFERFFLSSVEAGSRPALVDEGPFHGTEKAAHLLDLPIVTHFAKDSGPYVTSSLVIAKNMETGTQNVSVHRLLRLDDGRFAIRMVEGRHLHRAYTLARESGKDLPVSIVVGVHPAVEMAAAFQAPYGYDELMLANSLLGGRLTTCEVDNGLIVPAEAEFVMTGVIGSETAKEAMVEMLGNYDAVRAQPVIQVQKLYHRRGAIYRDILPGGLEHRMLMSYPIEIKMNKAVRDVVPSTRRVVLTDGGRNWLHAVIQISKHLEGEPKNALLAAFAAHPSLKMATVVDDDIDPDDPRMVEYAVATRFQASRGLMVITGAKGSSLDPSADQEMLLTDKLGVDATRTLKKPKEKFEIAEIPNYHSTVKRLLGEAR